MERVGKRVVLDTRTKIVDAARAAELRAAYPGMRFVTGYFDVLVASQTRALGRLAPDSGSKERPLMAVVVEPPDPLLNARARAELAAGLSVIDYVLLPEAPGPEGTVAGGSPEWLSGALSLEAEHEADRQDLITHVHRRQTG